MIVKIVRDCLHGACILEQRGVQFMYGKYLKLQEIFQDTVKQCTTNPKLIEEVKQSVGTQYIVKERDFVEQNKNKRPYEKSADLLVSKKKTLEAAQQYKGKKVAILNFANAINPGGGVVNGAIAQEECICRCSTLYLNLVQEDMVEHFYKVHEKDYHKGKLPYGSNDDCIFTPNVVMFKSDVEFPETLPEEEWMAVDVITCAAPCLIGCNIQEDKLREIHRKRIRKILELAKSEDEEVLILGAFGCGAFQNPVELVAEEMVRAVKEYENWFETVEFAVYCTERDRRNYEVFFGEVEGWNN